jgi:acetyl-CoA decarbonylase/synthase complex subunit gamma
MVVEQEMAEIYPPDAEGLSEFLPGTDCGACGFDDCTGFAAALIRSEMTPAQCPELDQEMARVMAAVLDLKKDPIPFNCMMEQMTCELLEINNPGEDSPLLITCNFQETVRILKEILDRTSSRAFLLPTHTHGYSVDNAVHEKMFKAVEIWKAMKENAVDDRISRRTLIIPGLAETEKNAIRQLTRWEVLVGPVSGFLLPLFLLQND